MGCDRRRRRSQRADRRGLPGPGRQVGAGAGAPRPARWRLHARAAVRRRPLPRQPLRLRRRAARPARDRGAGSRKARLPGVPGRPEPLVPVPRRDLLRRVPRRRADRRSHARQRFRRARHHRAVRLRGDVQPHPARAALRLAGRHLARFLADPRADRGRAVRRRRADLGRVRAVDRRQRSSATSTDPRLIHALFGQGVIGAFAGPRDPGTSSIKLMHHQGDLLGLGSVWGYVEGGMGRVSFAIAEAAREAGAVIAAGVPVAAITPGEGVELESGDFIRGRVVVSNADPKRTLAMLDSAGPPPAFRKRLEDWQVRSPVVKLNAGLSRLPTFTAAGSFEPHRAMVTITPGVDAAQEAFESCKRGEPAIGFAELYFQTGYDPTVAPPGRHVMSVFAQYAPYELADGDWDTRRDEIDEPDARRDRRLRARRPRLRRAQRSARSTRHRGARRPDRRPHLSGRGAARPDVGKPLRPPHSDRRASTCAAPPRIRPAR